MRLQPVHAALLFITVLQSTWACSCAAPPPPKESLAKSAAVFVGKVTKIADARGGSHLAVTFTVSRRWKGAAERNVVVITHKNGETCGYAFRPGEQYLVYAFHRRAKRDAAVASPELETNICTRTVGLAAADKDLQELGPSL